MLSGREVQFQLQGDDDVLEELLDVLFCGKLDGLSERAVESPLGKRVELKGKVALASASLKGALISIFPVDPNREMSRRHKSTRRTSLF